MISDQCRTATEVSPQRQFILFRVECQLATISTLYQTTSAKPGAAPPAKWIAQFSKHSPLYPCPHQEEGDFFRDKKIRRKLQILMQCVQGSNLSRGNYLSISLPSTEFLIMNFVVKRKRGMILKFTNIVGLSVAKLFTLAYSISILFKRQTLCPVIHLSSPS